MTECPMCKHIFNEEEQPKKDFRVSVLKGVIEELQEQLSLIKQSDNEAVK